MKMLIIVRRGEFADGKLTDDGRRTVRGLAGMLAPLVRGMSTLIFSSNDPPAIKSADILAEVLGVEVEVHRILHSESVGPEDLPCVLKLIRAYWKIADVLIISTHCGYAADLPSYFMREELHAEVCSQPIERGEALVIDCSKVTLTRVSCKP